MARLVNIVTIEVKQGNVDQVVEALLAHRERSLRDEAGVLQFEILRPRADDSTLMAYEVYESEVAFEDHRTAPSLTQLLSEITDLVSGLHGIRCEVVA